jgi:acyl carrier protein
MSFQDRISDLVHGKHLLASVSHNAVAAGTGFKGRIVTIVSDVLRQRSPTVKLGEGVTFESLGVNALERIYIADDIEREWDISIEEDDIDAWDCVTDIEQCVCKNLKYFARSQEWANVRTKMRMRFHPIADGKFDDLIEEIRRS